MRVTQNVITSLQGQEQATSKRTEGRIYKKTKSRSKFNCNESR